MVVEPIPSYTALVPGTVQGGEQVGYSWDNGSTWTSTLPVTPVTHVRWSDGLLPPAASEQVGFVVRVNDELPPDTTLRNRARITSDETAAVFDIWLPSNEVTVSTIDLWAEKEVNQAQVTAGAPVTFTIRYGNRGSADANDVRIRDGLPTGSSYIDGSIWGVGADAGDPVLLAWDVMTVPAGSSVSTVGYATLVASDLISGTILTNTANLVSRRLDLTTNAAAVRVSAMPEAELSITKVVSPDIISPGELITYSIRVVNMGATAHQLVVTDTIPKELSFVSCAGASCATSDRDVVWGPLELIGGGAALEVSVCGVVSETLPNGWPIVNRQYGARALNADTIVGLPLTTTVSLAELELVKWAYPDPVFTGGYLEYTLRVVNRGGSAEHLVVRDQLPEGAVYGGCACTSAGLLHSRPLGSVAPSACGDSFQCGLFNDTVIWSLDTLPPDRVVQMTFWVTVARQVEEGTLIVNDNFSATADFLTPLVGTEPVTSVVRQVLVSIAKSAWPDPVPLGDELHYTITLQNDGGPLTSLEVTDLIPSGALFVACAPGGSPEFECGQVGAGREVVWWLAELAAGATQELVFDVLANDVNRLFIENDRYGVRFPGADVALLGPPVTVTVLNPFQHRRYLPLVLSHYP
jgi:uncharacterized repeat protein (TIGR01451 family)